MPNQQPDPSEEAPVDAPGTTEPDLAELPLPAPTLNDSELRLPGEVDAPEFTARLQSLKEQFKNRIEYNLFVCDALAARGVQPNSNSVVKYGRWGSTSNVASDVRIWYASITQRLQTSQAKIPDAARRRANDLIEHLWELANELTAQPLGQEISDLKRDVASARDDNLALAQSNGALHADLEALRAQLLEASRINERISTDLQYTKDQHAKEISRSQLALSEAALSHRHALREAEQTLSSSMAAAAADLETTRKSAAIELAAERAKLAAAVEAHGANDLDHRNTIADLRDQLTKALRENGLVLDRARQDVRDANSRADQAESRAAGERAENTRLRDINATVSIDLARLQLQHDQLAQALEKIRSESAELREQGAAAQPEERSVAPPAAQSKRKK